MPQRQWEVFGFRSDANEAPNPLSPSSPAERFKWYVWPALLLSAFAPRAIMSTKITVLCPDATLYIQLAQAIESGNLREGLREVNLNTFPFILAALHGIGIDWEVAGKFWGVGVSSIAILPLLGWVNRQFDGRTAWIAAILYASHPSFVEWSPETIRDPTFWLLLPASLYFLWRAVTEHRSVFFLASGFSILFASLTRFEGLFLAIPMVCWCISHLRNSSSRLRLLRGAAICLSVPVALLLGVNAFLFSDVDQFQSVRQTPLSLGHRWLTAQLDSLLQWETLPTNPEIAPSDLLSVSERGLLMARAFESGISPLFGILVLVGIAANIRRWWHRDHRALLYVALVVTAGMWIHLWYAQRTSERYPLTIALLAMPWASLGVVSIANRIVVFPRLIRLKTAAAATVAMLSIVSAVGLFDAFSTTYHSRIARAEVGRTIRASTPSDTVVIGPRSLQRLVSYYARREYIVAADDLDVAMIRDASDKCESNTVVLIATNDPTRTEADLASAWDFSVEPSRQIPATDNRMIVIYYRDRARISSRLPRPKL